MTTAFFLLLQIHFPTPTVRFVVIQYSVDYSPECLNINTPYALLNATISPHFRGFVPIRCPPGGTPCRFKRLSVGRSACWAGWVISLINLNLYISFKNKVCACAVFRTSKQQQQQHMIPIDAICAMGFGVR